MVSIFTAPEQWVETTIEKQLICGNDVWLGIFIALSALYKAAADTLAYPEEEEDYIA